jgi:hypothetical protein
MLPQRVQKSEKRDYDDTFPTQGPVVLTEAEAEAVGGGLWGVVAAIAIGAALLLAHD